MALSYSVSGLEDLLKEFGPMLSRVAMSYEADAALREDLLQEIVFSIWKALPSFRGQAGLKTFVARVAHNRAVDHVVHRQRIQDRHAAGEDPAELSGAVANSLHERLDLASAIRRLPLNYRQCVELMLEGFSHAEIGQTLGLEENAVAQCLRRGRQRLKATLAKDDFHEHRS